MTTWREVYDRIWGKYGICPYCYAPTGEACVDQRWIHKRTRYCRKPHPERKHVKS